MSAEELLPLLAQAVRAMVAEISKSLENVAITLLQEIILRDELT